MQQRRLLFICNSASWGGLEINTLKFATWLQEGGYMVNVAVNQDFKLSEEAQKSGLATVHYPAKSHYKGWKGSSALVGHLKQHPTDLVILSLNQHLALPAICKLQGAKATFCYLQQMEIGIPKRDLYHTLIYRQLDFWIAPLKVLAEQVQAQTNFAAEKIIQIPLCIDTEVFSQHPLSQTEARAQLSLPQNDFLFGMIGRFDPHKGHEYFLRALHQLKQAGFEGKALMVGIKPGEQESAYGQSIHSLIVELDLADSVLFRPFSNEVATAFKALDVFVMPSPAETFGMVTVEAMATGVPVVGFAALGTKELLQDGKLGLLAPPKDALSLSKQMHQLWKDAGLRKKLAAQGKKHAQENFSKASFLEGVEQILSTV